MYKVPRASGTSWNAAWPALPSIQPAMIHPSIHRPSTGWHVVVVLVPVLVLDSYPSTPWTLKFHFSRVQTPHLSPRTGADSNPRHYPIDELQISSQRSTSRDSQSPLTPHKTASFYGSCYSHPTEQGSMCV